MSRQSDGKEIEASQGNPRFCKNSLQFLFKFGGMITEGVNLFLPVYWKPIVLVARVLHTTKRPQLGLIQMKGKYPTWYLMLV